MMIKKRCFLNQVQFNGSLGSSLGCGIKIVRPSDVVLRFAPPSEASSTYPSFSPNSSRSTVGATFSFLASDSTSRGQAVEAISDELLWSEAIVVAAALGAD